MPSFLPKFSASLRRWIIAGAVTPTLIVGLLCWSVMISSAGQSASARHRRITAGAASVLEQRILAIDSLVAQTALSADALGRGDRAAALSASLQSTSGLEALLVLTPEGSVRDVAMRADLTALRENLAGMDLSHFFDVLHPSPQGNIYHGTHSPLDGKPFLADTRKLASGETLLALLDVRRLATGLTDPGDDLSTVLWAPDCLLVLHADPKTDALLADLRSRSHATSQPAQFSDAHHLLAWAEAPAAGLRTSVSGIVRHDLAFTGAPLVALLATIITCALAALGAVVVSLRLSRPISSLGEQIKQAIARQEQSTLPPQSFVETESVADGARQLVIGCRDTQSRLATIQQAIQTASAPLSRSAESTVLGELAASLASVTGARCVLIAEWTAGIRPLAHVLAAHANVPLPKDLTYELSGTPSHRLATSPLVHVRTRVLREYPESPLLRMLGAESCVCVALVNGEGNVAGHLEIIDDQDIVLTDSLRDLLALFASRAAGELERLLAERLRAETLARYSEVRIDQQELICRWAADTTLTIVNNPVCRALETPREQLLGRSLIPFIHEDDREPFQQLFRDLSAANPVRSADFRIVGPQGPLWLRWTIRALIDGKGRITEYQATAADITELRRLLSELEQAELRFSVLAENCPAAFWITDWTTQRCVYTNPMFRRLWGISPEVASSNSMAWTDLVRDEDRASVVRQYLLHASEGLYQASYRIIRPDGTTAMISDRAIPLRGSEQGVHLVASIAYEIPADDSLNTGIQSNAAADLPAGS